MFQRLSKLKGVASHYQCRLLAAPKVSYKKWRAAQVHSTATSMTTGAKKLVLVVAVALLDGQGRMLIAQRPEGKTMAGLWEFPGGKVDSGEMPEQALVRELEEELNIQVDLKDLEPITFASHTYDNFHLLMPLYGCMKWKGAVQGMEGQQMAWVLPGELHSGDKYPMPPADIPLISPLINFIELKRQRGQKREITLEKRQTVGLMG